MYNWRYHIASLVAVFLALALGLVLGGLVVRQGGFDIQQQAIVSGLQKDFTKLKKENTTLRANLLLESAYSTQMTAAWTADRLKDRTVLIMTSGARSEGMSAASQAIKQAGGASAVITLARPGFGLDDSATAGVARSVVGSATDLKTSVASTLVSEWSQPGIPRPLTDALAKAGAITVTGLPGSQAATQVVDLAAFGGTPDGLALDVAQDYAAQGMYALGAETPASNTGVAAAAAARKLSAFDTLGSNAGAFTLVALFSGGQQGYYGTGAGANAQFPPVPTP